MPSAKPTVGVDDLATVFPEIAAEAHGWDPSLVKSGSSKKLEWKCTNNHVYQANVKNRTGKSQGCPYCTNKKVLAGFNDLETLRPDLAQDADGWDPKTVIIGSHKKLGWKCSEGHQWEAAVYSRSTGGNGCPYCGNRKVLKGFNDLATLYPSLVSQVLGWDPSTVAPQSNESRQWVCELGHQWKSPVYARTNLGAGCPYCTNSKVLSGFNDLATLYPEIASQAFGWDPSRILATSKSKRKFKCEKGHVWAAAIGARTGKRQSGCPICSKTGFNPGKPAWFYLLERPGEQQIGISNEIDVRLAVHARDGWQQVEIIGPFDGQKVLDTETALRNWLRDSNLLIPGKLENWTSVDLEVRSLAQLKKRSGIETDLF